MVEKASAREVSGCHSEKPLSPVLGDGQNKNQAQDRKNRPLLILLVAMDPQEFPRLVDTVRTDKIRLIDR
jgi:hypothetical protein